MRRLLLRLCLALAPLALMACATDRSFDADLTHLEGHPIHDAIARFGQPNATTDLDGGGHEYVWMQNYDVHMSTAPPPNKFGMVPPQQLASGESQPVETYTQNVRCWVRLTTDAAGKITDAKWSSGSGVGGCDRYASHLGGL